MFGQLDYPEPALRIIFSFKGQEVLGRRFPT